MSVRFTFWMFQETCFILLGFRILTSDSFFLNHTHSKYGRILDISIASYHSFFAFLKISVISIDILSNVFHAILSSSILLSNTFASFDKINALTSHSGEYLSAPKVLAILKSLVVEYPSYASVFIIQVLLSICIGLNLPFSHL